MPKTPRGKKAREAAEQERLLNYAKEWFTKLNREVFSMKLPENTDIIWNPKLISSAGRAHFKRYGKPFSFTLQSVNVRCACSTRDAEGNATYSCKVDLATKIIDSEGILLFLRYVFMDLFSCRAERMRNTLSHELCHLASWVIDGKLDEGHGRVWKSWYASDRLS